MIKKDYAAQAVIDFLLEDMNFSKTDAERYARLLMEAQAFTMDLKDLLTLIDESGERAKATGELTRDIKVEMPFESVYVEYTHCSVMPAMDDVDRCGIFFIANHAAVQEGGAAYPVVYMTIHYLNQRQLCTGAMVNHGEADDAVLELASRVQPGQKEFVTTAMKAMHVFTGTLMEAVVNGGVREYVPSALRRKLHAKRNKKHKLLEHKVLKLDLSKLGQRQMTGGGTHASPRLHLRRGHWRQYRNGKRRWIKPMWVGDKELGVVHKDYEVVA